MKKHNPYYRGPPTDHFDGIHFSNPTDKSTRNFKDFITWMRSRNKKLWPKWVELTQYDVPPARSAKLRISFVNHVTFLIQVNNINILTDPLWSMRASPSKFFGPKRAHAPGIAYKDLPHIDYVLVSHTHYDHLDLPTLKKIAIDHNPQIIVGLGVDKLLEKSSVVSKAYDWWESFESKEIKIHFVPSFHWSSRTHRDRNFTLWGGYVIETPSKKIYFAGDTGFDQGRPFEAIQQKFGQIDVALLPIGAYEPRWFMALAHMDPAEAIKAHKILNARTSIAMHYGCFQLTDEGIDDPINEFQQEMTKQSVPKADFKLLEPGQMAEFD